MVENSHSVVAERHKAKSTGARHIIKIQKLIFSLQVAMRSTVEISIGWFLVQLTVYSLAASSCCSEYRRPCAITILLLPMSRRDLSLQDSADKGRVRSV